MVLASAECEFSSRSLADRKSVVALCVWGSTYLINVSNCSLLESHKLHHTLVQTN